MEIGAQRNNDIYDMRDPQDIVVLVYRSRNIDFDESNFSNLKTLN